MNGKGEQWVVISAITVLGIYAYRRLTEGTTSTFSVKNALGLGNPLPVASFITAWGFVFLVISFMETFDEGLGGAFALLVMTTDFLTNAPALFSKGSQLTAAQEKANVGATPGLVDTSSGVAAYQPPTNIPGLVVVP